MIKLSTIAKSRAIKVVAAYLLLSILTQLVQPLSVLALTSGPGQPEFQGVTEVDMSQAVDPFSGDFSYNVPVLTVPGPNGGYPLNLTYSSGVGMEDEASWVGLGWTLTPGAINRNVRGVPDDFRGPVDNDPQSDHITQTQYTKPNVTAAIGVNMKFKFPEIFGADMGLDLGVNPNVNIYYNSYTGYGFRHGVGITLGPNESAEGPLSAGLSLDFDSNDGPSIQPSISLSAQGQRSRNTASFGMGYSSRQGITGMNFSTSRSMVKTVTSQETGKAVVSKNHNLNVSGSSISYAVGSGVPGVGIPQNGFNAGFQVDMEAGAAGNHLNIPIGFSGTLSVQKVKDYMQEGYAFPAYGTLYSQERMENAHIENDRALMDYNMEKEFPVNQKVPMIPMPVATHDLYSVSGSGIGGTFRPYRNDAGIFYNPPTNSNILGLNGGVEVAASTGLKLGFDPNVTFTRSYSGKWRNDDDKAIEMLGFKKQDAFTSNDGIRRNQPFTFRFTNEFLPNFEGEQSFANKGGYGPARVDIYNTPGAFEDFSSLRNEVDDPDATEQMGKKNFFKDLLIKKAKAASSLNGQPYSANAFINKEPRRRQNLVQYFTKAEKSAFGYPDVKHIYTGSFSDPKAGALSAYQEYSLPAQAKNHHVTGYDILKADGTRYVYDMPLYNTLQTEVFYSLYGSEFYQGGATTHPAKTESSSFTTAYDSKKGLAGTSDRAYTENKTGAYAHTYLLGYILSPDYIDVDGNGPSSNDFGYWTKFNYYQPTQFNWRMPYGQNEASYSAGYNSNPNDDKASVHYGEKQLSYLHSIETKTHIAIFYLSQREDGQGVDDVYGGPGGARLQKLDKIELYAKNDLNTPLKAVHFVYASAADELCKNLPNATTGRGKLTLKEVYFTYKGSTKGEQMRYRFEYGNIYKDASDGSGYLEEDGSANFDYSNMKVDRWGNYTFNNDPDNPYTNQKREATANAQRKQIAVSWNLTKIHLPTGATIRIDYESDDYAHVQNHPVTQMVQVAGTGYRDNGNIIPDWLDDSSCSIRKDNNIVFFEPLAEISNALSAGYKQAAVERYFEALPDNLLYFKVWEKLMVQNSTTQWKYDYVSGYARMKMSGGKPVCGYVTRTVGGSTLVYPYVELADADNPAKQYFRSAGLQYLRYNRTDLSRPPYDNSPVPSVVPIITGLASVIPQMFELIGGYYKTSIMKGHCAELAGNKPSFIRLGSPDSKKFGGGSRVRKLTVSDNWTVDGVSASQYGSEYLYKNSDGSSSGVATYEPILGNDENPMKRPHFYGPDNKFISNDPAYYLEEPFGESYLPAPMVGYSRVVINNIANNTVTRTGSGIQVKEFYTAKEFPVKTTFTQAPQHVEDKFNLMIPLYGSVTMKANGYSQGFYIELNDMHGKPKADYVYDRDLWDNANKQLRQGATAVTKTFYRYQTEGNYNPNGSNTLNSTITVVDKAGNKTSRRIGDVSEFFGSMHEDFTYSVSAGGQVNVGVDPAPYGFFITVFPSVSYNESSARIISTTKIVNKVGVLAEVETYKDGVTQRSKNLFYDEETGQPVLTAVTDDYDDPTSNINDRLVYTMQYPAHWYYGGMEPAYKNYRVHFSGDFDQVPNARNYFQEGDEVLEGSTRTYVSKVKPNAVERVDAAGTLVTNNPGTFTVSRSGKRNLQSAAAGKIVSLEDPALIYSSFLILQTVVQRYNALIAQGTAINNTPILLNPAPVVPLGDMILCDGSSYALEVSFTDLSVMTVRVTNNANPEEYCLNRFTVGSGPVLTGYTVGDVFLEYLNEKSLNFYRGANAPVKISHGGDPALGGFCPDLVQKCMEGILHADATEYAQNWIYRPEFTSGNSFFANNNDYRTGRKGIWRSKRANTYFTERRQYGADNGNTLGVTNIGYDGTYKLFVPFNWEYDYDGDGIVDGNAANVQAGNGWRWAAEVPENGYSPYGFEIENVDALGIYSSALYGYDNSLVTAVTKNAAYNEIGFDGFEQFGGGTYQSAGHLVLGYTSGAGAPVPTVVSSGAHTGKYALSYPGKTGSYLYIQAPVRSSVKDFSGTAQLQFVKGKSYTVGFWYKISENAYWNVRAKNNTTNAILGSAIVSLNQSDIEGWRRMEFSFTVPVTTGPGDILQLSIEPTDNSLITFDDIRIHPSDAAMQSFVYDRVNYTLRAQLDDNNYASFYNYDEEDNLVQTKKETERGIMTVQQTRKNTVKP